MSKRLKKYRARTNYGLFRFMYNYLYMTDEEVQEILYGFDLDPPKWYAACGAAPPNGSQIRPLYRCKRQQEHAGDHVRNIARSGTPDIYPDALVFHWR